MALNIDQIVLRMAEKVREIATRQGNVPFRTGDLRKSIITHALGNGAASVGSNLPYARAVHDGRPAITIRPKKKKFLFWKGAAHPVKEVHQPARKGKPFLMNAAKEMAKDLSFIEPYVTAEMMRVIEKATEHLRRINIG